MQRVGVTHCSRPGLVALTFDDAPAGPPAISSPEELPDAPLLAELTALRVRATFFVVGSKVTRPEQLARYLDPGHQIAFHSWTHAPFRRQDQAFYDLEIGRSEKVLSAAAGTRLAKYLRPPYLVLDADAKAELRRRNYTAVSASIDTRDWHPRTTTEHVSHMLTSSATLGDPAERSHIVLMHVDKNNSAVRGAPAMLRTVVPLLRRNGFRFVRVDECVHGVQTAPRLRRTSSVRVPRRSGAVWPSVRFSPKLSTVGWSYSWRARELCRVGAEQSRVAAEGG